MARKIVPVPASLQEYLQLPNKDKAWLLVHKKPAMEQFFAASFKPEDYAMNFYLQISQMYSDLIQKNKATFEGRKLGGNRKREKSETEEKKLAVKILWEQHCADSRKETIESFADRIEEDVGVPSGTIKKWVTQFRKEKKRAC